MNWISEEFIKENITYQELIKALKLAFRQDEVECPPKLAYDYSSNTNKEDNNTLLFMPAWDNQSYFGVKLITATPTNKAQKLPYLNGLYILFDAENGMPLVSMDAKLITNMRTAATSVLASDYLAKDNASRVLIMGNGNLSSAYIEAYASKPGIDSIYLWGRNFERTKDVIASLSINNSIQIEAVQDFEELIKEVHIISCITSSYKPIVDIRHISNGQHLDLAGSYTADMLEVTTEVVADCSVYTDNYNITVGHAGELVNAIKEKKLSVADIRGDLKSLCKDDKIKRASQNENTLFKSTGMAIEDLIIASMIYSKSK